MNILTFIIRMPLLFVPKLCLKKRRNQILSHQNEIGKQFQGEFITGDCNSTTKTKITLFC